eukprot:gene5738-9561_t
MSDRDSREKSPERSRKYDDDERSGGRKYEEVKENPGNVLYVHGLGPQIKESDVKDLFSKEGKVEKVTIIVDPQTNENRGFGFVEMATSQEADDCIKNLDGTEFVNTKISVEKSKRSGARDKTPGRYMGSGRRDFGRRYDDRRYDRYDDRRGYDRRGGYDRRDDRRYDRYDDRRGGYDRRDDRRDDRRGGYDRNDRDSYKKRYSPERRNYDRNEDRGYQKKSDDYYQK